MNITYNLKKKNDKFHHLISNHTLIFSIILLINLLIFFSFINGYFYSRQQIEEKSENLELFSRKVFGDEYVESLKKQKNTFSIINAPYNKVVLLLIDSLRFDFILYDTNYEEEFVGKEKNTDIYNNMFSEKKNISNEGKKNENSLYFLNNMINVHNTLKNEKNNSLLFRFDADAPTITTSRLKSIFMGTIPNYMEVNENFSPTTSIEDNFFEQLHLNNKKVIAIGDNTITHLMKHFSKELVYESFNVFDFYTLDIAAKKHFYEEYLSNDWDIMYIHMLAVDHIGHIKTPNSKVMKDVLKDFDVFIYDIINKIKLDNLKKLNTEQKEKEKIKIIKKKKKKKSHQNGTHIENENDDNIEDIQNDDNNEDIQNDDNIEDIQNDDNIEDIQNDDNNEDIQNQSDQKNDDKKTLFLFFGDHGQLDTGDHGGYSVDETHSALFAYSPLTFITLDEDIIQNNFVLYDKDKLKKYISTLNEENNYKENIDNYKKYHSYLKDINKKYTYHYNVKYTKQVNLMSTISLLIGSTIPYGNIGNIIMDFIPNAYINNKNNSSLPNDTTNLYYDLLNLHYIAELNYANLWQLNRYLNEYEKKYNIIKNEDYHFIKSSWSIIEKEKKEFFFQPNKKFIKNDNILLKKEKETYIQFINEMTTLMDITQKYFYYIFNIKEKYFLILSIVLNIFLFLFLKHFYYYSKLNYYHKLIKGSKILLFISLFLNIIVTFDYFNKNIYLLLSLCAFLLYFFTFCLSSKEYKDIFRIFSHAKIIFISNNINMIIPSIKNYNISAKHNINNTNNDNYHTSYKHRKSFTNKEKKQNNTHINIFYNIIYFLRIIKKKIVKYIMFMHLTVYNLTIGNIIYILFKLFPKIIAISFKILRNNYFIFVVIIWSCCETSFNYIDKERYYIHYILIAYVLFCLLKWKSHRVCNILRAFILLLLLITNALYSHTPEYFDHGKEKIYLKESILKSFLPISSYIFSIILINSGINNLLKKRIKIIIMQIWTIQYILVFLFLNNIYHTYIQFITPPSIYFLTFSTFIFILLSKNILNEKEKLPDSLDKIYEVCITLFVIIITAIPLSFIIYSNTNLGVLFLFYITFLLFYFILISSNYSKDINQTNDITLKWINENMNNTNTMININESLENKEKHPSYNTSIKEKFYYELMIEKLKLLNTCSLLNEGEIMQIQIYKLIRDISYFYINEIDFYILSCLLLKYSFFITGHKFILNNLPLVSGYVGLYKYVWPVSQFYIFNHIFFPFFFTLFFIIYIYHIRRIKIINSLKKFDLYYFYVYPLMNFFFKVSFMFCCKFIVSVWVSYYLNLHIMLYDYFLPNMFYLFFINLIFIIFCLLSFSMTKYIFLR
ncbi:GPI ethanolamine phosphate transferase 3, putative [Plasmodium gaboni]|uniref:GPI ethanolamine phosphate transferase 3, putative n=1 Tax=Plasmodium gaboni TaxID=647221 RepID=A0ABY1UQ01_9APIC|nr:GPI ethanolamine phosphate transferase 3, putative [Plasmodium gaboni]